MRIAWPSPATCAASSCWFPNRTCVARRVAAGLAPCVSGRATAPDGIIAAEAPDEDGGVRQRTLRRMWITFACLVPAGVALAGCGASSIPPQTTTLPAGTRVGPREFLADSAATAAAIRSFADALGANGSTLTDAQAKASAPLLASDYQQAQTGYGRLAAQRVDDARLDAQRQAVVDKLGPVVVQMSDITTAARAGDAKAVVAHLAPLRAAVANVELAGA